MRQKRFAGIEVASDLSRGNFFFLYLNTFLVGILLSVPGIMQPAFLKDVIGVSDEFFGSINGALQSISQVASLLFIGVIGLVSDKTGRKPLVVAGFFVLAVFYVLFLYSNSIASVLRIPAGLSAVLCAALSFSTARESFLPFAPGLIMAYVNRFVIGLGLVMVFPQFKTMVADYTQEKDRGKGMAFNGIMFGLASMIVFTVLAPVGKKSGIEMLFYIAAVIGLAGAALSLAGLKERLPERVPGGSPLRDVVRVVRKSFALKAGFLCGLVTRVDMALTATFLIAWAVQLAPQYGLSSEEASLRGAVPMMVMSAFTFLAFPVFGVLLDRWGRVPVIIMSLVLGGLGFVCVSAAPAPFVGPVTVAGVLFVGCSACGAVVGSNTLTADAAPRELVGATLGGLNTMAQVGMIIFLALGGVLFDRVGPWGVFLTKGVVNITLAALLFATRKKIIIHPEE